MRDFLKNVLATFVGLALFAALSATGLVTLLVFLALSSKETGPQVEKNSILAIDLSEPIVDANQSADPGEVLSGALSGETPNDTIALRRVLRSIEAAAKDDRIKAIYLYDSVVPANLGSGYATLREVRQALQAFRDAGKPIFAYDDGSWAERDYYLASVANTILLNPTAGLELNGLSLEQTFYAGALQKYGVGVQVLRAGKYKSAVEPFIRNNNSPESREESQSLLNDLWTEVLTTSAKSRNLTPEKLQSIADTQGLLLPDQAQAAGLIDKVVYKDEVVTQLQGLTGEDRSHKSFRQISLDEYATTLLQKEKNSSQNKIAVIYAEGDIVSGEGRTGQIGGDTLSEQLRELRLDDSVKAIVLRVNSPGGSATASDQIAREVMLTKQVKPVIVSMGSYAASGGYYISSYANRIFASPNTVTGSIGVFGLLTNFKTIANSNGVTWDTIKTGRYADSSTVSRPKSPEELAVGQRVVDRLYDQFLNVVSSSRPIPRARVAEIAQGRVWSGVQAKQLGLVDELGGLEDAIQAAAKQANLNKDWQLEEYPRRQLFRAKLLRRLLNSYLPVLHTATPVTPHDPLTLQLLEMKADFETLRSMNDPLGAYSRLPFNPWIH